jgi:GH15 family glucan-1,4-alpha-glucosidase
MHQKYRRISEYAAIGNLRTAALVGRDGSIDWCCFPHFDRGSVFAAILDERRGGKFRVSPAGSAWIGEQEYIADTNVVQTRFKTGAGALTVTDLMPLWGDIHGTENSHGGKGSHAPPAIIRFLECDGQSVEVEVEWSPRFDYGRAVPEIRREGEGWIATSEKGTLSLGGLEDADVTDEDSGPVLRAQFVMNGGDRRFLVTRWESTDVTYDSQSLGEMLEQTVETWKKWTHQKASRLWDQWAGEWLPMLVRSVLALKLLTHTDTGAIVAAPTTSLPETIGGVRNWDYRYSWIRDASQTAQAFIALGHEVEAIEFLEWIERVSMQHFEEGKAPQIMYGIHGEADLPEEELLHLEGYRGSRPVRIGNGAAEQDQHEVFGELFLTGYELLRRGIGLGSHIYTFLGRVADYTCRVWREPDHGIWEVRGEMRHYVYSKLMCWVALDYAVHFVERFGLTGDVDTWRRTRDEIRADILKNGYDRDLGSFVQYYGSKNLDASNLRIPTLEFLPYDDPRVQGTVDRTMKHLLVDGLVYRHNADDHLPGEEGAFGLCTFWLVDALALSGRTTEAQEIFLQMLRHVNSVGLFPEEFDPATGEYLGNYPQGFTHVGLINSALNLAFALGRDLPEHALIGTADHRRSLGKRHAKYHMTAGEGSPRGEAR